MKYLKQLGFNALLGIIAGGIVDLVSALMDKKKNRWGCTILRDSDYIASVHNWYFDFDKHLMTNGDNRDEVLIDFNTSPAPTKEMIRLIEMYYK